MRAPVLLIFPFLLLVAAGARSEDPPQRIAALAPHVVEMLYLLGAGDRIVVTVDHADHPPAAAALPRIGDAFTLSLEALVAARPDLVIAWGGALDGRRRAQLEALVPGLFVSEPRDLDDVADELDRLAARIGSGAQAARRFRRRLEALAPATGDRARVLPVVSITPLMTLGHGSFVDDVLRRCGAENPLAGDGAVVIQLSREMLLVTEFDYVLPLGTVVADGLAPLFADAVATLAVDADLLSRPGPRLLDGAERLCALLAAEGV